MVLLTDVYGNLTSLCIKPRERAFRQFKSPVLNVLSFLSLLNMLCISRLCWTTCTVTNTLSYLGQFLVTTQTFHQVYHTIMEFIYFIRFLL